jgi:hypothetical protein
MPAAVERPFLRVVFLAAFRFAVLRGLARLAAAFLRTDFARIATFRFAAFNRLDRALARLDAFLAMLFLLRPGNSAYASATIRTSVKLVTTPIKAALFRK